MVGVGGGRNKGRGQSKAKKAKRSKWGKIAGFGMLAGAMVGLGLGASGLGAYASGNTTSLSPGHLRYLHELSKSSPLGGVRTFRV